MHALFCLDNLNKYIQNIKSVQIYLKTNSLMAQKQEIKEASENNLDFNQIMKVVKNNDDLAK